MSHVENCIIKRMLAAFPPPTHLRGRPEAIEMTLETYRSGLAHFDRETLDEAWLRVSQAHRFWNWPMLSDIVKAAESLRPRVKTDDWVERVTTREDEYVRRFMQTTQAAVRAREGGYEQEMKRYILAVAHVQAQYIEGRREGVGYESAVLFPGMERDKAAEGEWFARQREQAQAGSIRVRVPLALVERWKEGAEKGRVR